MWKLSLEGWEDASVCGGYTVCYAALDSQHAHARARTHTQTHKIRTGNTIVSINAELGVI